MSVHCDNQSVIHLTKNSKFHDITKHVDIRLHFIRNEMEKGEIKIEKIKMEENVSNFLTKAMPRSILSTV